MTERNDNGTVLSMKRIGWSLFAAAFFIGSLSFAHACWIVMHIFVPGAPFVILLSGAASILFLAITALGVFKAMQSPHGKS